MKKILLFLLAAWIFLFAAIGQNYKFPISNYTNKAYGRNHEATNYCIITDHRNLVYAGNANGIMEYDGSEWRFIPVRQGAHVTSLNISSGGTIFVGSEQEFGFLDIDRTGSLHYQSLSQQLPEKDRYFSAVWRTHTSENMTAFQAYECIFILKDDSLQTLYPETSFHTSFMVNSNLYVRERGIGLKVLQGDEFVPVRGGEVFSDLGIFGMFPYDESGKILISTQEKGFFLFDPLRGIERMPTDNDEFLIRAAIFGGIALADSNIALNSQHEGVIICDRNGNIKSVINKSGGLKADDVKGIWQDRQHNIWCALNNGISKINYSSPLSFYQEDAGLEGSVNTLVRFKDKLYVGTTSGLFIESNSNMLNKSLDFIPLHIIQDQVWCLRSVEGSLVAGTANGLFLIRDNRAVKISSLNAFSMLYLEKERLLLVGGNGGLAVFSPARDWKMLSHINEIQMDIKAIAHNPDSYYNATEIWLGSNLRGAMKILIYPDLSYETFQYTGMMDGLPETWVLPFTHRDSVVFGTQEGIFRFVDEYIIREMLPDSLKNIPEYSRGYFENSLFYEIRPELPFSFVINAFNRTWAVADNEIRLIHHDGLADIIEKPFRSIDLGKINYIYPEDENTVWFAASDGLARFNLAQPEKPVGDFHAAIRTVVITGDSIIYKGAIKQPQFYTVDDPDDILEQAEDDIPVLDHAYNDLTFFFTSPFYEKESENQFSWMLEGDNAGWSSWSTRRVISYTNLQEGEYTFVLRIKNIYGDISEPAGFRFIIQPPWYRTVPSYIAGMILMVLFIYAAVRLGQRRLRRKNERLEAIVQQRTEEIRHQNIELAAQKKEITDSIYYAERIQRAILPHTDRIKEHIEDYFILFQPKDIVSGDFYWLAENGNKIIIAAADCTGHGVPGAFMSMLGVSFLNKIIIENNILNADAILNQLRENVISALKQTGQEGEARDGMDMALVVIDLEGMSMEFAGANNPLYMIREDEIDITRADRMPIAYQRDAGNFVNHKIELRKGDTFFMFSDGYADQFGGAKGKKFMYKSFKQLLVDSREKSMKDIHNILDVTLREWKAPDGPDGKVYEQVDDILVMGIRI